MREGTKLWLPAAYNEAPILLSKTKRINLIIKVTNMYWLLVLIIFNHSHTAALAEYKIATAPTQQMCQQLKNSIKKHSPDTVFSCVRGY